MHCSLASYIYGEDIIIKESVICLNVLTVIAYYINQDQLTIISGTTILSIHSFTSYFLRSFL